VGADPQQTFTQNGSNDVYSRSKIATFHTPWSPGPLKSQNLAFLDLENFRPILPLTLEVREKTPFYSSSEPNESGMANKQSGGEKLKYVYLNFT